jgi:hypothetical protein
MELFTSGDQSQMAVIRKWIDESDVYMLILGGRYGSIEPESGLSYTELEYDYAVSTSKPLFAVALKDGAIDERVKASGLAVAEIDNPALLKSFKAKVLSNLAAFFVDERDVKLAVFETLPNYAANRNLVGWVRGDNIIDSAPFREQNERLALENERLRAQLAAAQQKVERARDPEEERIRDLMETLESIALVVPVNLLSLGAEEPWETNQLTFLGVNANTLVGGITNRANESDQTKFLYLNVANVLAVHGVMKSVLGEGQVRSYELTPFGQKVLATVHARHHREERDAAMLAELSVNESDDGARQMAADPTAPSAELPSPASPKVTKVRRAEASQKSPKAAPNPARKARVKAGAPRRTRDA